MIRGYSDHAANERTFLAWVRTGIAVIVFGFVIEKFNLLLLTMASTAAIDRALQARLEKLSGTLGFVEGLALIVGGAALIVVAGFRFLRTRRLIDDPDTHEIGRAHVELALLAGLVLLVGGLSAYVAFG